MKKRMIQNSYRIVLKVQLQTSDLLTVENYPKETYYTGNHIAIFECELKSPPLLSLSDHSYIEYLMAHRINFRNWKLVDIDNYMKGNPFFSEQVSKFEWNERVKGKLGKIEEPEIKSQI